MMFYVIGTSFKPRSDLLGRSYLIWSLCMNMMDPCFLCQIVLFSA